MVDRAHCEPDVLIICMMSSSELPDGFLFFFGVSMVALVARDVDDSRMGVISLSSAC